MSARAHVAMSVFAILCCFGCENPGDAPTTGILYSPNALALSIEEEPRHLFVASSNFDLRFNAGSLLAFSIAAIDDAIDACPRLGAEECTVETQDVLADEVIIPTYATGIAVAPDGRRLFVTSRTRRSVQVIDVDPDASAEAFIDGGDPLTARLLSCGEGETRACDQFSAPGVDRATSANIELPINPADLVAGRLSDLSGDAADDERSFVAVAHQTGDVSLLVDDDDGQLTLSAVLDELGPTPTSIALDPLSQELHVARRGADLLRVGIAAPQPGQSESADRFSLFFAGALGLEGAAIADVRALTFLAPAVATDGQLASRALVVAGVPSALVLADVTPRAGGRLNGRVMQMTEVGTGAERLVVGTIGDRSFAAISCLEGRALYLVDLTTMQVRAVVPNLSGPHGVAFDAARERLYVNDFRSSVVRIVDLSSLADPASDQTVQVIATLGRPRIVQELK
jgi:DNA-binding beta-propeller fold protein YncE